MIVTDYNSETRISLEGSSSSRGTSNDNQQLNQVVEVATTALRNKRTVTKYTLSENKYKIIKCAVSLTTYAWMCGLASHRFPIATTVIGLALLVTQGAYLYHVIVPEEDVKDISTDIRGKTK